MHFVFMGKRFDELRKKIFIKSSEITVLENSKVLLRFGF